MNLSCSSRMIKYLMFAFNLFFVISGIIIISVGATAKTVYSDYSDFLDSKYFTLPNMLIAIGAFIFLISFFGCCGAVRESWIMLGVFSILLCIIFIFEFSAGIAGYVLRDKTIAYLDSTLRANLKNYETSSHGIWDSIQSNFHCCGVDSYTDWKETFPNDPFALPVSCCPAVSGTAGTFHCNSYTTTVSSEGTTASTIISPSTSAATEASTSASTEASTSASTEASTSASTESTTAPPTTPTTTPATSATTASSSSTAAPILPANRKRREVNDEPQAETSTTISTPSAPSTSTPYTTGCKAAFGQYVKKHAVQLGGCALGLAIIQILGIVFSCHLVRQLKNGYYST